MKFIKALLPLVIIPLFGFIVANWILYSWSKEIADNDLDVTIRELCSPEFISQFFLLKEMCGEVAPIIRLETWSVISVAIATLLLLSFLLFVLIAGKSRTRIAKIFPPLISSTLVILAGLVVLQGAIFTYGVYIVAEVYEVYALYRVGIVAIYLIGLGSLIGGLKLIVSSFKLAKKQTHYVLGKELNASEHPNLFSLIKEISEKLGARNPDNVVVGLEPNFYVTSADVNLDGTGRTLKGETLYLSLPLARILTLEEIKAIIGHELGHFRGADTYYSLRFAPIYAGLSHAVSTMGGSKDEQGGHIAELPALFVLSYILDVFHTNISSISREREFAADKAASEVASPEAISSSLLKIGLYEGAWHNLQIKIIARMREGRITRNLSQIFASIVKYDVNEESIPKIIDSIAKQTIMHPTDSHPPTATRIAELGVDIDNIERALLVMPKNTCIDLLQNPVQIEEELTAAQQARFVALGIVEMPEKVTSSAGAFIIAAFGAHMVVADGKVEPEEIDEAESIGISLAPNFDYIEFREFCLYPESIPLIEDLLESSKDIPDESKLIIFEYLGKIARADAEISSEEEQLLDKVKASFNL